jgi:hypothetical protein
MMGKVDETFPPNRMHLATYDLERNNRAEDGECPIFVAVGVGKCGVHRIFRWLTLLISVFEFLVQQAERDPNAGGTAIPSIGKSLL